MNHSTPNTSLFALHVIFTESSLSQVLSQPDVLTIALFLFLLTLLCVVGNALVCRTILVTRRLHFPGYYFVASLAVADFLVGVLVLPISLAYLITFRMKGRWIFGELVCDAWALANLWFSCASVSSLCAITWDRYVAVTSPLRYVMRMNDHHVIRLTVFIWLTSFITAVFNCYGLKTSPTRVLCEVTGLPLVYGLVDFVFIFLVPLVCVVFVSCKVWLAASRQIRRIQAQIPQAFELHDTENNSTNDASSSQGQAITYRHRTFRKEIKTFRTFLVVISSFFFSWTPFHIMVLVHYFRKVPGILAYLCVTLTYINSACNPLVYGIFNRDFRQALLYSLKWRT